MRRIEYYVFLVAAVVATAACQKVNTDTKDQVDPEASAMVFTASIEGLESKTTLTGDRKVVWTAGDEISINGIVYVATPQDGDASKATFSKKNASDEDPAAPYNAYYPASLYNSGNASLPETITTNSIESLPMYATGSSTELSFKNICGVIALTVNKSLIDNVNTVTVKSSNCSMSGEFTVDADFNAVLSDAAKAAMNTVECRKGTSTDDAVVFYIPVPAQTYLHLNFYVVNEHDAKKSMTTKLNRQITIERNAVYPLTFVEAGPEIIDEPANCYIVSKAGTYGFPATKGNSNESVGEVASVAVLWESNGTSTAPSVGSLVSNVAYANGTISFQASNVKGNAVIAAKDASGNILWSWHIWLTDTPETHVYKNGTRVIDRSLGAISAEPGDVGDVGAVGLMYQWGRKDPFMGSSSITSVSMAASTLSEWPIVDSGKTVAYATANPTTFIKGDSTNGDWLSSKDDSLWGSTKTIYDPCPAGYRVPDGGDKGLWSMSLGTVGNDVDPDNSDVQNTTYTESSESNGSAWNPSKRGVQLGSGSTKEIGFQESIWYQASGFISNETGYLVNVGNFGRVWSCTTTENDAYNFHFNRANLFPTASNNRANGHSVRCVKIQ
uniref:Fibrobacter succinogenes major paralogous domain-containing protein n=1 Tax=uncultured bacterium fosmid pJB42G5 TaxID=1478064 RepID=A0A0H3U7J8_9BACT|nr:hypothetical protein [uncultured bacterium fosmid pJB42G5]